MEIYLLFQFLKLILFEFLTQLGAMVNEMINYTKIFSSENIQYFQLNQIYK